ncbi:concanavalin A-like lectin/glucanase domain-containing protein, partial [Halteromyces radiatus]|uniref:concanavalin A-like lectin/glucanase domain-containing protein n=1 Tax=Halteromyces radiatus TaxID=101107 RepID=UPI002220E2F1
CKSVTTDFTKSHAGWKALDSSKTYAFTKNGLELKLLKPKKYIRKIDKATNLPYNVYPGEGSTFNYTTYLQYGSFSATMKPSTVGGAVTAFIGIGNGGDEIDFEFLGGNSQNIQSNYFWGKKIVYGINGGVHPLPGNALPGSAYHTYTINWTPTQIQWSIDGKIVRTKTRASTRDSRGQYEYPTEPLRIQLGIWDSSTVPGTAQWANGPINWDKQKSSVKAYIKKVTITC